MFVLSLILVLLSSYFILSFLYSKYYSKKFPAFLYLLLIIFSQIILTVEILSLFKFISPIGVIWFNILFLILGLSLIWKKKLYVPKMEFNPFINALKRDKILIFLSVCFIIFLVSEFIIAGFAPVKFGDALNYYLPRCTMWIQQGSISHYITPDTRELIMPVNMEFLYTWFLMLKKTEIGTACFSYISFIAGIYILFNFLRETGCSIRRSLWSVFVFSSFALAAVEMTTPCSDLFAGVLVLSSIYLFLLYSKADCWQNDRFAEDERRSCTRLMQNGQNRSQFRILASLRTIVKQSSLHFSGLLRRYTPLNDNNAAPASTEEAPTEMPLNAKMSLCRKAAALPQADRWKADKLSLIFSALSYAIAAGTKTTCLMAFPALLFIFVVISLLYAKPKIKSNLIKFTLLFLGLFIVFSSYNYILNFIQFSNPLSDKPQILIHQLQGGFKGFICNIIKYFFVLFDTSGINTIIDFNGFITSLQTAVLGLIGETPESYTSNYFSRQFFFNPQITIQSSALGVMGMFAFLPSIIKSVKRFFKNRKSRHTILFAALSTALFINVCILAGTMVFAQYNIRYLLTFTIISLPIIAYSYIKKNKSFCKILMCFFMFFYLVFNPLNLLFQERNGITRFSQIQAEEFLVHNYMKGIDKLYKIAMIAPQDRMPVYHIEKLRIEGYNIDKLLLENIKTYDLSKYKYIITSKLDVVSTYILKNPLKEKSQCIYYDKDQSIINNKNDEIPVMIDCEPQIEYFIKNGFQILYNGGHYIILG